MKKIMFLIMCGLMVGCAPTVYVEQEPCLTCSDAIVGADLNKDNACPGSLELWQEYKVGTCAEPSICKVYCAESLCSGKPPSSDCRQCAKFGTIFHPHQVDENYFTCKSDE
jgi:hypothetical protein